MQYSVGQVGRTVVARLENNDPIYESVLTICQKENIINAAVWIIGGVQKAGVVVGLESSTDLYSDPVVENFDDAREILGIGTVFPDENNELILHLHAGIGSKNNSIIGCPRIKANCWLINEIVIMELTGIKAKRIKDVNSEFKLLQLIR